jgi:hypothetical protein
MVSLKTSLDLRKELNLVGFQGIGLQQFLEKIIDRMIEIEDMIFEIDEKINETQNK